MSEPQSIFDVIHPLRTQVMVEEHARSERVGALYRPERYQDASKPRSGVVRKVGPSVRAVSPGDIIFWGFHSGTVRKMNGEACTMLPEEEILAKTVVDWDGDPDESVIEGLKPRPGQAIVERLEMPLRRGKIYIPDGTLTSTRSSEAVVLAVGEGVDVVAPGDGVLLAPSVSRSLNLGHRTVSICTPSHEIVAKVDLSDPIHSDTSPLAGADELPPIDATVKWDEGDTTGPQ